MKSQKREFSTNIPHSRDIASSLLISLEGPLDDNAVFATLVSKNIAISPGTIPLTPATNEPIAVMDRSIKRLTSSKTAQ
jgi:hypothetical protein